MFFKTSVAAFYLSGTDYSIQALVATAGMTDVDQLNEEEIKGFGSGFSSTSIFYGRWGAFGATWTKADLLQGITCLQFYFSINTFFDLVNVNDDNTITEIDISNPMRTTFSFACQQLDPLLAFVD